MSLLPRGKRVLEDIVRQRLDELRDRGHAFVAAIAAILDESESTEIALEFEVLALVTGRER